MLVIYSQSLANPLYKQQIAFIESDKAGLAERDVAIETHILSKQSTGLFNRNHIRKGFTITLIGKDGGEKFRSTRVVSLKQLYAAIDAMPMRKDEIKRRNK